MIFLPLGALHFTRPPVPNPRPVTSTARSVASRALHAASRCQPIPKTAPAPSAFRSEGALTRAFATSKNLSASLFSTAEVFGRVPPQMARPRSKDSPKRCTGYILASDPLNGIVQSVQRLRWAKRKIKKEGDQFAEPGKARRHPPRPHRGRPSGLHGRAPQNRRERRLLKLLSS
jgi:hypothetical protein